MTLAQQVNRLQLLLSMKYMILIASAGLSACASSNNPGPIKRQMVGLIEKFDRWDVNGDGDLSEAELKPAEKLSSFSAGEIVEFYDTDGDRKISLEEAQKGVKRLPEAQEIAAEQEA